MRGARARYRSMLLAIARRASANSAGVLAVSPEAWSAPPAKWTSDLTVRRSDCRWDGPGRELAKIATAAAVAYTDSVAFLFSLFAHVTFPASHRAARSRWLLLGSRLLVEVICRESSLRQLWQIIRTDCWGK